MSEQNTLISQSVLDLQGEVRYLSELLQGRPAVIGFLRHFG